MKLSAVLSPLPRLKDALKFAFVPFLEDVWNHVRDRKHRWRLTDFIELRRMFFAHLWNAFGPGSDENARNPNLQELLEPATGVVLDIGAGLGHSMLYLTRNKVSRYIAVEPNELMHSGLRDAAQKAVFLESDGSFVLLPCGAEDVQTNLESALNGRDIQSEIGFVDSIICILTLCSIPNAEKTITRIIRDILRPGGTLFVFEHVQNPHKDVAWWQWFWSPLWSVFFDGCRLDCPSDKWMEEMKDVNSYGEVQMWKEKNAKRESEESWEQSMMPHVVGRFTKHD